MGAVNGKGQCPKLTLTGERRNGHLLVRVQDRPLWVSYGHFCRLARLVLARGVLPSGFVADPDLLYPEAVCRLRRVIDRAVAPGAGAALIETGVGREYRLAIPVTAVALGPELAELAGLGVLTPEELTQLRAFCQKEPGAATGRRGCAGRPALRPRCDREVTGT